MSKIFGTKILAEVNSLCQRGMISNENRKRFACAIKNFMRSGIKTELYDAIDELPLVGEKRNELNKLYKLVEEA